MEEENTPPSSHPKLSLSLKRRFAALERERGSRAVFFSDGSQTYGAEQRTASNLKSGEETTTEETPAARFVETLVYGVSGVG